MIPNIAYLAHPVAPPCTCDYGAHGAGDGLAAYNKRTIECNCQRALRWLRWAINTYPDVAFCAPWIPYALILRDPGNGRVRGLRDDLATAVRCDEIWLVGGKVSTGMALERNAMIEAGKLVNDLTHLGPEPPDAETI